MRLWKLPTGWEWKKMSDVCVINPPRARLQRDDNAPTSFVPMKAINGATGKIAGMQVRPYGEIKKGYISFQENDVLFAKITPSVENGKVAIARGLIDGIGFGSTEFHVIRPGPGVLPEWIFYYIRRSLFREEARNSFRGTAGQQRVPEEFLADYPIPIPYPNNVLLSLLVQRRIVTRLEMVIGAINEVFALIEEIAYNLESLSDTIVEKTLSG